MFLNRVTAVMLVGALLNAAVVAKNESVAAEQATQACRKCTDPDWSTVSGYCNQWGDQRQVNLYFQGTSGQEWKVCNCCTTPMAFSTEISKTWGDRTVTTDGKKDVECQYRKGSGRSADKIQAWYETTKLNCPK